MTNGATGGKQSLLAVASLVCALLFFFPPAWAAALVLGIVALVEIKQAGGSLRGRGLAITGMTLSCIWSVALTVFIISVIRSNRSNVGETWPPAGEYTEPLGEAPEESATATPAAPAATPAAPVATPATSPETPPAKEPAAPAKAQ